MRIGSTTRRYSSGWLETTRRIGMIVTNTATNGGATPTHNARRWRTIAFLCAAACLAEAGCASRPRSSAAQPELAALIGLSFGPEGFREIAETGAGSPYRAQGVRPSARSL